MQTIFRRLAISGVAAFCALGIAHEASTRDGNTLGEAVSDLRARLTAAPIAATYEVAVTAGSLKGTKWTSKNAYRDFTVSDCELSWEQTNQKNDNHVRAFRFVVPLRDVASATYKLDDGSEGTNFLYSVRIPELVMKTRTRSIQWRKGFPTTDQATIEFGTDPKSSRRRIERIAAAIQRAGALCASRSANAAAAPGSAEGAR